MGRKRKPPDTLTESVVLLLERVSTMVASIRTEVSHLQPPAV